MPKVLIPLFFSILFIVALLGIYYLYNINIIDLSLSPFNFKINKIYSLDKAFENASKDCKIIFSELYKEHEKRSPQEEIILKKEIMQEYRKYISSLFEKVGVKVGPAPDYQIIDNLSYYNMGTKIPSTQGCWAIIYTEKNSNYFAYEKFNGDIVKILVNRVR